MIVTSLATNFGSISCYVFGKEQEQTYYIFL